MGFIVLVVLILLAAAGTWVAGSMLGNETTDLRGNAVTTNRSSILHATAVVGAVVLIAILFAVRSVTTIDPGHIGIKKQFGKLTGTTGNGWVFHNPVTNVVSVSVQNELRSYDMGENNSAVSSDSQPVYLTVQVNYSLERAGAVQLYQNTGGQYVERILDPAVYQDTKEVTAQYKAVEFAANREKIRKQIEQKLTLDVGKVKDEKSGQLIPAFRINSVALKNVDFTPALKKAIEDTVEANQNAKRAQAQVAIATAEAEQKVATAKGNRDAAIAEAEGQAQAQRLKQKTLTPELLTQQAIDKLNPNVQVIVCGEGKNCIPNAVLAVASGK